MTEMTKDVSRRDALKRGAILGGTLVWAAPVVQTIGMTKAYAADPSGPGNGENGPSYIAMNITCGGVGQSSTAYSIKYEGCTEPDDCFESDPGRTPGCTGLFDFEGTATDGDNLGFLVAGPHPTTGCVTVRVPAGCTVLESVIKKGNECWPGPTGNGDLQFCPG
jgi:hypothetical protein